MNKDVNSVQQEASELFAQLAEWYRAIVFLPLTQMPSGEIRGALQDRYRNREYLFQYFSWQEAVGNISRWLKFEVEQETRNKHEIIEELERKLTYLKELKLFAGWWIEANRILKDDNESSMVLTSANGRRYDANS